MRTGFAISVFKTKGESINPFLIEESSAPSLYEKAKKLYEKVRNEADRKPSDISGLLNQLRELAH